METNKYIYLYVLQSDCGRINHAIKPKRPQHSIYHRPHKGHLMKKNKYIYLYVLQGNYGYGHGWEDLTASESWSMVCEDRRAYIENEGGNYRVIQRRELNPNYGSAK